MKNSTPMEPRVAPSRVSVAIERNALGRMLEHELITPDDLDAILRDHNGRGAIWRKNNQNEELTYGW